MRLFGRIVVVVVVVGGFKSAFSAQSVRAWRSTSSSVMQLSFSHPKDVRLSFS